MWSPRLVSMAVADGTLNKIELHYPDDRVYTATSKDLVTDIPSGTLYVQEAGGGGGYGSPFERPAQRVREEVKNGIVSIDAARRLYGVAVDPETFELLAEETTRLREKKES